MNKRVQWGVLMVMTLGVTAMAIDFMGPPTATLKKGQWKTDFTYHLSENDLELTDAVIGGVDVGDFDLEDFEIQRYYATFGYGIDDRWEIYGKLGGVDVEQDDSEFSSGSDIAFGWGTKITTNKSKEVDWGIAAQMSWFQSDDDPSWSETIDGDTYALNSRLDIDAYELQVAAGPTFKFPGWKLYGGVFYYMLDGDLDAKGTFTQNGNPLAIGTASADVEEDSNVGGYVGTLMHLTKNIDATVELAFISGGWGAGGSIGWKF